MHVNQTLAKACQVLRRKVRYKNAGLTLPTTSFPGNDTPAIQEATRLYVESWIVPILNRIERGDMAALARCISHDIGDEMDPEP